MHPLVIVLKHLIPALQSIKQDLERESTASPQPQAETHIHYDSARTEEPKAMLTIQEASAFLSISKAWLCNKVSQRQIPHYKMGSRVLFSQEKLREWLRRATCIPKCRS